MAHNRIGRLIQTTRCKGEYYDKNNQKWPFDIKVWGKYDVDSMTRKVKTVLKTDRFLINPDTIEHDEFWASMPIDKFVDNADRMPHKPRKENDNG